MESMHTATIVSSLTPLLVVLYLAWKEYKSGNSQLSKKIQDDYKERNEQLEQRVADLEKDHQMYALQINKLETILEEKDKQLDRYEKIFANRNPDLTDILKEIRDFMNAIHEQNMRQTAMLEMSHQRDTIVDSAAGVGIKVKEIVKDNK